MKTRPMTTTRHLPGSSRDTVPSSEAVVSASSSVPASTRVIVSTGGTQTTVLPAEELPVVRQERLPAAASAGAVAEPDVPQVPRKPAVTVIIDPNTGRSRTQ